MKVKTLRRNLGELLGRLNMAHAHLLAIPYQKLRQLLLTLRGVEKGLKIVEADEMRTPHETPRQTPAEGLESCRDSKDKVREIETEYTVYLWKPDRNKSHVGIVSLIGVLNAGIEDTYQQI